MKQIIRILSSYRTLDILCFAASWSIVVGLANYPGSIPTMVNLCIIVGLTAVSVPLCIGNKSWRILFNVSRLPKWSYVFSVLWAIAMATVFFANQEIVNIVGNLAEVILVIGLVLYAIHNNTYNRYLP